jgi:transketolase C-terminal domain/subunit
MSKVIAEKVQEAVTADAPKQVEIKHTRVMKDAAGKDVTVVDWSDVKPVDEAISQAEAELVVAEANVVALKADIVEYKKIKG